MDRGMGLYFHFVTFSTSFLSCLMTAHEGGFIEWLQSMMWRLLVEVLPD